ncbi:MAG: hypothetical protein PHN19_04255 [Patescibacteria group bacterium]|nr:hypothetical protein [Patescibacteria group bacterium]
MKKVFRIIFLILAIFFLLLVFCTYYELSTSFNMQACPTEGDPTHPTVCFTKETIFENPYYYRIMFYFVGIDILFWISYSLLRRKSKS